MLNHPVDSSRNCNGIWFFSSKRILNVFRRDPKNAGDWWSPPCKYFNLGKDEEDLLSIKKINPNVDLIVVGGGGLGRYGVFKESLDHLSAAGRKYKLIAWGVGADTITTKNRLINADKDTSREEINELLSFYKHFDIVGTRIYSDEIKWDSKLRWVPCASCMNNLFDDLRKTQPTAKVGVFTHLRVDARKHIYANLWDRLSKNYPRISNKNCNLAQKLIFMARFETIITNSYHGAYWATLLNRKVICLPYKNGLFTLKHKPTYYDGKASLDLTIKDARNYPKALEECRDVNIDFFNSLRHSQ